MGPLHGNMQNMGSKPQSFSLSGNLCFHLADGVEFQLRPGLGNMRCREQWPKRLVLHKTVLGCYLHLLLFLPIDVSVTRSIWEFGRENNNPGMCLWCDNPSIVIYVSSQTSALARVVPLLGNFVLHGLKNSMLFSVQRLLDTDNSLMAGLSDF